VETQGRTVASAERGQVFEAFKDADRARRHGSLGLGLSLARSIFQIHGGNVQVDMTPGGGCLFHVHLPTSAQRVQMALTIACGLAPEDAPTLGSPATRLQGA
jgi:signal transduction histidine kinase